MDQIGLLYRVHRVTASRWLAGARKAVLSHTRRLLTDQLDISAEEFESIVRLVQSQLDLSILPAIGKKKIMLGVINVGSNRVEQVFELVERGKEALQFLSPEQLIFSPDCGMLQLSRKSAQKKLINLAKAVAILNERIR